MLRVVTARSKAAVLILNKTNSHESFRSDKHVGCFSFHTKHQRHDEPITQKYQNTCEYLASKLVHRQQYATMSGMPSSLNNLGDTLFTSGFINQYKYKSKCIKSYRLKSSSESDYCNQ